MSDGDVDYSKYTLRELEEALAGINRHQYPKNYANLCIAYEHLRPAPAEFAERQVSNATEDASEGERQTTALGALWNSRLVGGLIGAVCLWWAYEILAHPGSCPSGTRFMGMIVKATCERLGQVAAASIPFLLGLMSVALALSPRRRGGA